MSDVVAPFDRRDSPNQVFILAAGRAWKPRNREIISRLLVECGVTRRIQSETVANLAARTDRNSKTNALRRFCRCCRKFRRRKNGIPECLQFSGKNDASRGSNGLRCDCSMRNRHRARRLRARQPKIDSQRWRFLQHRCGGGVGWHVLNLRQRERFRLRWPSCARSERRIFGVDPTQ